MFDSWHWEGKADAKLSLGNLSAGNHSITIYGREIGRGTVPLDQILLTMDPNYIATDNSPNANNENNIIKSTENLSLKGDVDLKSKDGSLSPKALYFLNSSSTAKLTVNFKSTGEWYAWGRMLFESER